jgi:hypothetical protein
MDTPISPASSTSNASTVLGGGGLAGHDDVGHGNEGPDPAELVLASARTHGVDGGVVAFLAYDLCGASSPIRKCVPGNALYNGVLASHLGVDAAGDRGVAARLREGIRRGLLSPVTGSAFWAQVRGDGEEDPELPDMENSFMVQNMKALRKELFGRIRTPNNTREERICAMKRGADFMKDVLDHVGTDYRRDPALETLRASWTAGCADVTKHDGWRSVCFPIVFHLQWDPQMDPTKRPRMLFHTSFDPWRTAMALGMALCSPKPPIQIRETPYKDNDPTQAYRPPRKYVVDWDLYVRENLGNAGPPSTFTEARLLDMFVRSLAIIHAYMRKLKVLPSNKRMCVSIKSREREAQNKAGKPDRKCSYHATFHIMEPAERHRMVIEKVVDMVRKDKPEAYKLMTEKDGTKRGIRDPAQYKRLGDYAGFMAFDTAMTKNWHQPVQSIGSSKGDGVVFKHRALVVFKGTTGDLEIDPARDYHVFHAKTDRDRFPNEYPFHMGMLILQHSASMPDRYCITYTPDDKWDRLRFGGGALARSTGERGTHALMAIGMSAARGAKRGRDGSLLSSGASTPQSPMGSVGVATTPASILARSVVPDWVMACFANAVRDTTLGREVFTVGNFSQHPYNLKEGGFPEIADLRNLRGTSFDVRRCPCIVHAALFGTLKIHRKCDAAIWVAETARVAKTREEVVYMKCWHPLCRDAVREASARGGGVFDKFGWAHLTKENIRSIRA